MYFYIRYRAVYLLISSSLILAVLIEPLVFLLLCIVNVTYDMQPSVTVLLKCKAVPFLFGVFFSSSYRYRYHVPLQKVLYSRNFQSMILVMRTTFVRILFLISQLYLTCQFKTSFIVLSKIFTSSLTVLPFA
jgi:hypothetical protein